MLQVDVVVETGISGRPDIEFGLREKAENGSRKDVRGRVAEFFERRHRHGVVGFSPPYEWRAERVIGDRDSLLVNADLSQGAAATKHIKPKRSGDRLSGERLFRQ